MSVTLDSQSSANATGRVVTKALVTSREMTIRTSGSPIKKHSEMITAEIKMNIIGTSFSQDGAKSVCLDGFFVWGA